MTDPITHEKREQLIALLRESETLSAELLKSIGVNRQLFESLGMGAFAELFKVLEFTILLRFDTAVLLSDFIAHELADRAHVYARFLVLTIYESTKTYRVLLGRSLQEKLREQTGFAAFRERVRIVHKALSKLSDDVAKRYGDVRDGIAAHRDPEALRQLHRLRGIGGFEMMDLAIRFTADVMELEKMLHDFTAVIASAFQHHLQRLLLPIGTESRIEVSVGTAAGASSLVDCDRFTWKSHDESVVQVDAAGTVRGIRTGYTRVTFGNHEDDRVTGGVIVFVGTTEQLVVFDEAWRSIFQPR